MSSATSSRRVGILWPLLIGVAAILIGLLVYRLSPEDSPAGRAATETETMIRDVPKRARRVVDLARQRYALAKSAFHSAKVESEKALLNQLQEAKERGSVPPL